MAWTLLQVAINGAIFSAIGILWLKLRKPPQDDPRLSRGLQLLQSKITILEDLSDRTDNQVKQLTQILDQKTRYIQDKIILAEQQILKVEQSMAKSLEVAEIFQDRIPHEEVLERKRTIEYVKAARMANQGKSVEEIAAHVSLPREQVELIAKFNREQLMFDEEALPEWAKSEAAGASNYSALGSIDFLNSLDVPSHDPVALQRVEENFRASVKEFDARQAAPPATASATATEESGTTKAILGAAQSITQSLASTAANFLAIQEIPTASAGPTVKRVEFPRIQAPPKY